MENKKLIQKALLLLMIYSIFQILMNMISAFSFTENLQFYSKLSDYSLGQRIIMEYFLTNVVQIIIHLITVIVLLILLSNTNRLKFGVILIVVINVALSMTMLPIRLYYLKDIETIDSITYRSLYLIPYLLTFGLLCLGLIFISKNQLLKGLKILILSYGFSLSFLIYEGFRRFSFTNRVFQIIVNNRELSQVDFTNYLIESLLVILVIVIVTVFLFGLINILITQKENVKHFKILIAIINLVLIVAVIYQATKNIYWFLENDYLNSGQTSIFIGGVFNQFLIKIYYILNTIFSLFIPLYIIKETKNKLKNTEENKDYLVE